MADIDVKHSAPLAERDIADETADTLKRGLADSLIVSGAGTGKEVDLQKLQKVHKAAAGAPIFLGSGVSEKNIERYSSLVDGFIVGTAFKEGGNVDQCVDKKRVLSFMKKLRSQYK
jgi:membrane complex biogenesis BtpA family protein